MPNKAPEQLPATTSNSRRWLRASASFRASMCRTLPPHFTSTLSCCLVDANWRARKRL
jgi:hypothetical protein